MEISNLLYLSSDNYKAIRKWNETRLTVSIIHDWNIQPLFQAAPDETGSKGEDFILLIYDCQKEK